MDKSRSTLLYLVFATILLAGCSEKKPIIHNKGKIASQPIVSANKPSSIAAKDQRPLQNESIEVITHPERITVLVNKHNKLPETYKPDDLMDPDIPFIFEQKTSKRKMRVEAASAIEKLFAGAKEDGVRLLGVSAYRSHAAQTVLFNHYVDIDGFEKASIYSALPGTSEHETGLAIDVTGENRKCAAEDCFGGTKEAGWLADHAAEYGFIIRYPKGKEDITGYQYEPWHLRYVGSKVAKEITRRRITLEEYNNILPVNK